jgi:hypothetical protein
MKLKVVKTVSRLGVTQKVVQVIRVSPFGIPAGIPPTDFLAKGDLLVGTGAGTHITKAAGADGTFLKYDSTKPGGLDAVVISVGGAQVLQVQVFS